MARSKEVKSNPKTKAKAKVKAKAKETAATKVRSTTRPKVSKYQVAIDAAKNYHFTGRPVFFASATEQNADKHTTFEAVSIHTAKCDGCEKHNTSVLQRCLTCSHQICRSCMTLDRDGIHPPRNDMNWVPSTIPHTTPRNPGRLGRGIVSGRVTKRGRGGGGRARGHRAIIESDESDGADSEAFEAIDNEEEPPKSKKGKGGNNQPPGSSRCVKRKRPVDNDDEGMFVEQSESESDEDDDPEYIPPTRARTTRRVRQFRAQSPTISRTDSSGNLIATSAAINYDEEAAYKSSSSNVRASSAFFEDEDFYNATPLSSPQLRIQRLATIIGGVGSSTMTPKEPNQELVAETKDTYHDANSSQSPNNSKHMTAPPSQSLPRALSSDLSSLPSTPSFDNDDNIRDSETSEAMEGAEALLQLCSGR